MEGHAAPVRINYRRYAARLMRRGATRQKARALFGAGDSEHRLNIDLANVFAAWTDTISSVKRPALGIECTVRSFGTLEALRSFSYLSCHSKVISLTFYDQRVPSWSELKLGVLRTQQ
jgi:hypothetical protein